VTGQRLYLVHPKVPPLLVISFDKASHHFVGERKDGSRFVDPNFHIDIVKRCGYSLTVEIPKEFEHA
jgi:hypothetical protein